MQSSKPHGVQQITLLCPGPLVDKLQILESKAPKDCALTVSESTQFLKSNPEHPLNSYFRALTTTSFGRCVMYSPLISSTQTILKNELIDTPDGSVFVADRQSAGKGRGDHVWTSPEGCLMFSIKCQFANPKRLAFLQYIASLGLVNVLKQAPENQNLDVRIKWPNDLYTSKGLKLGGILCQSSFSHSGTFDVTIGIGLNVDNDSPTTSVNALLRSLPHTTPFSRFELLANFISTFERDLHTLADRGFEPFLQQYLKEWLHSQQVVELKAAAEQEKPQRLVIKSISLDNGFLIASSEDGSTLYELHPEGHSLDWMQGLMVHKVIR